ncbi:MAG: universal stress protein [Propioniciclava sp.]|uniref:universal stress protein n=1 Tax=Propioniciclava sp. TaxID=2038686 RepID=UPI0039E25F79
MTVVVGTSPTHHTAEGIHLGALLARSVDADLVIVCVIPSPWEERGVGIDRDHLDLLTERAKTSVDELTRVIPDDLRWRVVVLESPSVSIGLLEAIEHFEASWLVLGSSTAGLLGRVALGGVTERLLHSAPVPVAVAPRGFTAGPDARLERVSVGFVAAPDESALVLNAAEMAASVGARLRLASFAARPPGPETSGIGLHAEDDVIDVWAAGLAEAAAGLQGEVAALAQAPAQEDPVIGRGPTWISALESVPWSAGDVLVVGSSRTARVAHVFLGGTASKIARHSPVPVIVVPRGAIER